MALLASTPPAAHTTPEKRQSRTKKTRPAAQRRVYGKRKADAPRAVFDQRSPPKDQESAKDVVIVDDAVDSIQTKLAEIKIEEQAESSSPEEKEDTPEQENEQKNESPVDSTNDQDTPDTPIPSNESTDDQPEPEPEPTPSKTKPKRQPKYETMVEVRIPISKISATPQTQHKESESRQTTSEVKKRTTRKKTPAPRLSSGCVQDDKANAYVRSILDEALSPLAAQGVQKFGSWAARAGNMLQVVKLAEGSYGEVYKLRLREEVCKQEMSKSKLARLKAYGDNVFKVVPLRAQSGPGSKKFTSVEELVSEVKMLKYLDPIPGFARFREIHVVQGRFPENFQDAWNHYKKTKDDCLNPNPSSKRAYPDTQIWAIVEMDDAGCELEKFSWSSVFQIYDIFWGVAMALARAEEYALFEHRDLHLGNVCIRTTRTDNCMDPPTDLDIARRSYTSGFGLSTLETTIIDYSLSRAELQLSDDPNGTLEVASSDLDKKQIFDAVGEDEDEVLLRDTYRHMRAQVYTGDPTQTQKTPDIPGIWSEYAPRTNLVWLLFLLKNLMKNRKVEVPQQPPAQRNPLAERSPNKNIEAKKNDKSGKKQAAKPLVSQISSTEISSKVGQLKNTLEERLQAVLGLLDLETGHEDMCCAADLVAYAIDSQWLDEQDFF